MDDSPQAFFPPTRLGLGNRAIAIVIGLAIVAAAAEIVRAQVAPAMRAAVPPRDEPPTQTDLLLGDAIKKLKAIEAFSVELNERVEMLGEKFSITGVAEKRPKNRIYLELVVKGLANASGTMLQVCDGNTFWEYDQVFGTKIWYRIDAGKILERIRAANASDEIVAHFSNRIGFGGPEVLLGQFRRWMKFEKHEKGTLDIDGRPVWILHGTWKRPDTLPVSETQPLALFVEMPPYMPSDVTLYLGEADLWPYKIVLEGKKSSLPVDTRPVGPDGRRIGPLTMVQKPLMTRIEMVYSNLKLRPVAERTFRYTPPKGAKIEDETKAILEELGRALAERAAKLKAEASESDGQTLPESLDAPRIAPRREVRPPLPGR